MLGWKCFVYVFWGFVKIIFGWKCFFLNKELISKPHQSHERKKHQTLSRPTEGYRAQRAKDHEKVANKSLRTTNTINAPSKLLPISLTDRPCVPKSVLAPLVYARDKFSKEATGWDSQNHDAMLSKRPLGGMSPRAQFLLLPKKVLFVGPRCFWRLLTTQPQSTGSWIVQSDRWVSRPLERKVAKIQQNTSQKPAKNQQEEQPTKSTIQRQKHSKTPFNSSNTLQNQTKNHQTNQTSTPPAASQRLLLRRFLKRRYSDVNTSRST